MNRHFSKEDVQMANEEMLKVPGHKGSANKNDIKISSYPSQNGYHQEHKQYLGSFW
jgi:hypothetical protein